MKPYLLLLLFLSLTSQAQHRIIGVVADSQTNAAIPFATIRTPNKPVYLADINGRFSIPTDSTELVTVTYAGYQSRTLQLNPTNYVRIPMTKSPDDPTSSTKAQAVIGNLLRLKKELARNPMKLKSYNRIIITANPDSIDGRIDTISRKRIRHGLKFKIDSSDYKFKKIIEKQHLFQSEKVSQLEYSAGKLRETIIGTKMAGLEKPLYEIFAFKLISFSIYDEPLTIFGTKYSNPLSDYAFEYYDFRLTDTISIDGRKTYAIRFSPTKNLPQSALNGIYLIDAANFSVAKTVITISGMIDVTVEHVSRYSASANKFLPQNLSVKVVKGDNEEEIRILGEALSIAATPIDAGSPRYASDFAYLLSETTFFDHEPDAPDVAHNSRFAIAIPDDALHKDDDFWNAHRPKSLDNRSLLTYAALDSLARKEGVERKLLLGRKVINGYLPVGFFDFDLRYLISFNNYEGFRLGAGGKTNDLLSEKFRLYGYTAYGTKDGEFKYQFGSSIRAHKDSDTWLGLSYTDDLHEIASTNFAVDKRTFKIYDPRPINVSTFYNYVAWRAYADTKIIPGTESIWQISHNRIRPQFGYSFRNKGQLYKNFSLTAAMVSIQWNPFSEYMKTPSGIIETEKRFPKFTFQIMQSIPDVLDNDLLFGKIEVRSVFEKKFLNRHNISAVFEAGRAYGELPITHAYNTSPNNLDKDRLLQRITFAGKDSFETMYFNEFFSDRFLFMQYKYAFGRLLLSDKIKPTPVLATRMVWGDMDNGERHMGIEFKTLENGYFESGIEFNGIFKGLGLSAFYRYGSYHLPEFEDNIAVKLSFVINIGF